jgi:D-inositol-3-phosphate glycosyltransferase
VQNATPSVKDRVVDKDIRVPGGRAPMPRVQADVALLTGGTEKHYTYGLGMALISKGVSLDIVGGDRVDCPEMHTTPGLNFLNLRGSQRPDATLAKKISRLSLYYARLISYAWTSRAKIFHILWNNRFQLFDRTLLMLYYKSKGKKIVLTAHNVNEARRDQHDSFLNRLTLRIQYRLADHIFVHTAKMKDELLKDFGTREQAVTVIPFGIYNMVPRTSLTSAEARSRLGISEGDKAILFFGNMRPSKGLAYLLPAFERISALDPHYRLIIAGRGIKNFERQWKEIQPTISRLFKQGLVVLKDEFIPDEEMELYFKAADVLVLPYTEIFQSGVLFMGYSFGLPVIATDVGSLGEDIIEGKTGFLCKPRDPIDLAGAIERYFQSDLFRNATHHRHEIQSYAEAHHSWDIAGTKTFNVYADLIRSDFLAGRGRPVSS